MKRTLALVLTISLVVVIVAFYSIGTCERKSEVAHIESNASQVVSPSSATSSSSAAAVMSAPRDVKWVFDNKVLTDRQLVTIPVPSQFASPSVPVPQAQAVVGDHVYRFEAANGGFFPKIDVALKSVIPISVYYPQGKPGDTVVVQSLDGGLFDNKTVVQTVQLDSSQQGSFDLHLTANPGVFRVMLRTSGQEKILNFWAGPELPMSAAN